MLPTMPSIVFWNLPSRLVSVSNASLRLFTRLCLRIMTREGAAFVFFPNRYIHESWRSEMMQQPVWQLLAGCERSEGRLAAFVSDRAALPPPAAVAFDTPPSKEANAPSKPKPEDGLLELLEKAEE